LGEAVLAPCPAKNIVVCALTSDDSSSVSGTKPFAVTDRGADVAFELSLFILSGLATIQLSSGFMLSQTGRNPAEAGNH
jgi:hypothetical protein